MSTPNDAPGRRTRRNLTKAAALIAGALVGAPFAAKPAAAGHHGGGDACFRRGTRIRTARGYRRIETLSVGDLLPTRFGGLVPIEKIASFTADDATKVVRVGRSAFADNVPACELWLTAPHAVYLDGVLVSIGDLANDTTIASEESTGEFFHIELGTHDVIDAEGAACESLLTPAMTRCAPRLAIDGGRSQLKSRLRSAVAVIVDRRTPLDVIRDKVEERSLPF